jgi:hypothetical protein
MKTLLQIVVALMLTVGMAHAQQTVTVTDHNSDGSTTITQCTGYTGGDVDCKTVPGDPRSLKDIHNEVKAREAFCKLNNIPTSRMSTKKNQQCVDAWQAHKLQEEVK